MRKALRKIWHLLKDEHSSPRELGFAAALGLFVGALPLYGLHLGICIALAWLLRLNKATVYLFANISNPLLIPPLVAGGIAIGEWLRFGAWRPLDLEQGRDFAAKLSIFSGRLPDLFASCMLGDALIGLVLAALFGPVVWLAARRFQRRGAHQEGV
ncbi:MAG: DUF2062 domain-containing protein [Pseudomonadota bacterium]